MESFAGESGREILEVPGELRREPGGKIIALDVTPGIIALKVCADAIVRAFKGQFPTPHIPAAANNELGLLVGFITGLSKSKPVKIGRRPARGGLRPPSTVVCGQFGSFRQFRRIAARRGGVGVGTELPAIC